MTRKITKTTIFWMIITIRNMKSGEFSGYTDRKCISEYSPSLL